MTISQIEAKEYLPYFSNFLNLLDDKSNLIDVLTQSGEEAAAFFKSVPEEKHHYFYAEGKWNLKEIINHLIDTERIFNYRALSISRQDKAILNGFNENEYAANSNATNRDINALIEEFQLVRSATIALFKSFTPEMQTYIGKAGSGDVSVRALGFIIAGHETHHITVFKERYM